jgi:hypothetical protein
MPIPNIVISKRQMHLVVLIMYIPTSGIFNKGSKRQIPSVYLKEFKVSWGMLE